MIVCSWPCAKFYGMFFLQRKEWSWEFYSLIKIWRGHRYCLMPSALESLVVFGLGAVAKVINLSRVLPSWKVPRVSCVVWSQIACPVKVSTLWILDRCVSGSQVAPFAFGLRCGLALFSALATGIMPRGSDDKSRSPKNCCEGSGLPPGAMVVATPWFTLSLAWRRRISMIRGRRHRVPSSLLAETDTTGAASASLHHASREHPGGWSHPGPDPACGGFCRSGASTCKRCAQPTTARPLAMGDCIRGPLGTSPPEAVSMMTSPVPGPPPRVDLPPPPRRLPATGSCPPVTMRHGLQSCRLRMVAIVARCWNGRRGHRWARLGGGGPLRQEAQQQTKLPSASSSGSNRSSRPCSNALNSKKLLYQKHRKRKRQRDDPTCKGDRARRTAPAGDYRKATPGLVS